MAAARPLREARLFRVVPRARAFARLLLPASSCSHRLTSRTPAQRACSCRGPWRRSWRRRRRSGPRTGSCGEPARWRWVSRPGPHRARGARRWKGPSPPAHVSSSSRPGRVREILLGPWSGGRVLPPVQDVQIRGENPQIPVSISSGLGEKQEGLGLATWVLRKLIAAFGLGNKRTRVFKALDSRSPRASWDVKSDL